MFEGLSKIVHAYWWWFGGRAAPKELQVLTCMTELKKHVFPRFFSPFIGGPSPLPRSSAFWRRDTGVRTGGGGNGDTGVDERWSREGASGESERDTSRLRAFWAFFFFLGMAEAGDSQSSSVGHSRRAEAGGPT